MCFVRQLFGLALLPGKLYLSERHLRFLGSGSAADGSLESVSSGAFARDSALTWALSSVKQMHRRRYLLEHSALELFDDSGSMLMINLKSKRMRTAVM